MLSYSMKKFFLLLTLGFIFIACEGADPEIIDTYYQINILKDAQNNEYSELLSFYAQVVDEDGDNDIKALYLINDEQELFWRFSPANWSRVVKNENRWIGSSMISMPDASAFLRGRYRIVVEDASGSRVEKSFELSTEGVDPKKLDFPSLRVDNKSIRIDNRKEDLQAFYFNSAKRFITAEYLDKDVYVADEFPRIVDLKSSSGNRVYLYDFLEEDGFGLLCGPYYSLYDLTLGKSEKSGN